MWENPPVSKQEMEMNILALLEADPVLNMIKLTLQSGYIKHPGVTQ